MGIISNIAVIGFFLIALVIAFSIFETVILESL